MTTKPTGGPAFPSLNPTMTGIDSDGTERWETEPCGGMGLRDYFAAKALPVAWSAFDQGYTGDQECIELSIANHAYQIADAMLAARNA